MSALTARFAQYAAMIRHEDLPAEVETRTRFLILDLLGNIIRGRHDAESSAPLLAAARAMGLAHGNHAVFGEVSRWSPTGAALLNGAFAHSLDFDDTHAAGTLHPGAPVIPAALAAAELTGASGEDVIAAIVAGYEVTNRLALALPGGDHYDRGYHPTATCGVFGGAAAAGRVMGLSEAQIAERWASPSANRPAACNSSPMGRGPSASRWAGPPWPGFRPRCWRARVSAVRPRRWRARPASCAPMPPTPIRSALSRALALNMS